MRGPEVLEAVLDSVAEAPERLAATLDQHSEALLAFDAGRTIIAANEAAGRFFGHERDALMKQSTDVLVPQRLRQPNAPPPLATR